MNRKSAATDPEQQDFAFLNATPEEVAAAGRESDQGGVDVVPAGDQVMEISGGDAPAELPVIMPLAESPSVAEADIPVTAESHSPEAAAPVSAVIPAAIVSRVHSTSALTEPATAVTRRQRILLGYAISVTLFLLFAWLTGRLSLFGNASLESLPDVRPLAPNEFRKVPDDTKLPDGHAMRLGESRRFGDVIVTPVRVTREPLRFEGFQTGAVIEQLTTTPVLKLWLTFENVADDYAFPPYDAALMSHRTPLDTTDDSTVANSHLTIVGSSGSATRVLNFLQTMDSNFELIGQQSGHVAGPGETVTTFVASSTTLPDESSLSDSSCVWRVQIRKGANSARTAGVTTLIDVAFATSDIEVTAAL